MQKQTTSSSEGAMIVNTGATPSGTLEQVPFTTTGLTRVSTSPHCLWSRVGNCSMAQMAARIYRFVFRPSDWCQGWATSTCAELDFFLGKYRKYESALLCLPAGIHRNSFGGLFHLWFSHQFDERSKYHPFVGHLVSSRRL